MMTKKFSRIIRIFIGTMIVAIISLIFLNANNAIPEQEIIRQYIQNCSCERDFFYPPPVVFIQKQNSSCSDEGTFYETGQKVVSMTFYVREKNSRFEKRRKLYIEGLKENLKAIREFYPGTTLRIYTNVDLKDEYCDLVCRNSDLFWCDIRKTPSLGDQHDMVFRTWRFLPLGDPSVAYFLSRDLDSVIIEREVPVVRIWLGTNKAIHVMRDHMWHGVPLPAGLWGARNCLLGNDAVLIRNKIMEMAKQRKYQNKHADQTILSRVIFKERSNDMIAFDSYLCTGWKGKVEVRPFPTRRKNSRTDFVGNIGLGRKEYNLRKCPVACRPEYGKNWDYC